MKARLKVACMNLNTRAYRIVMHMSEVLHHHSEYARRCKIAGNTIIRGDNIRKGIQLITLSRDMLDNEENFRLKTEISTRAWGKGLCSYERYRISSSHITVLICISNCRCACTDNQPPHFLRPCDLT